MCEKEVFALKDHCENEMRQIPSFNKWLLGAYSVSSHTGCRELQ
jgi:hypothetical protein